LDVAQTTERGTATHSRPSCERKTRKNRRSGDPARESAKGIFLFRPTGRSSLVLTRSAKAATVHNDETAKLRAAKESLEAAQVAAQKKQEAELERLRTQLVFKQLEMESSRKAAPPRAPAPSQASASSSQLPRWDVPSTPRRQHRPLAAQSPSPNHRKRPVPGSSKAPHAPLPGFVNDFAIPPAKKAKGTVRAHASQSQGIREWDLGPPMRTQVDEHMDHYSDGQVDHPELDLHMDLGDDVRAPQPPQVASSSIKPFDWLGWVGIMLVCFVPRAQGSDR
jgi:hypothetical protein